MDNRIKLYNISRPFKISAALESQQHHPPPPPPIPPQAVSAPTNNAVRPLSDIRELSEPSVADPIFRRAGNQMHQSANGFRSNALGNEDSLKSRGVEKEARHLGSQAHAHLQPAVDGSSSYSTTPEQSSFYSIPQSSVPQRSSSQHHGRPTARNHARKPSIRAKPPPPLPKFEGFTVPNRGHSRSPVKSAGMRLDVVKSDLGRRVPSKTCVRKPHPADILEFPSHRHPRVKLELQVSAPLFVGGGSIEGQVKMTVDENEWIRSRRSLGIGAISVDLLGFEDVSCSRRASFLAIGTELIDNTHPPPANMVQPPNPLSPNEKFWTLTPSTSTLPFMISLPLDTGPPPFQSKHANIRFLLCVTALISDAGKHYRVRTSQDVSVLATYDPEKALTSLSSPLTAVDEISFPRFGRCDTLKITAGLHRQVWVSGSSVFVDVHVANRTYKPVRKVELTLERDILCYKHAPAGTKEKSASQARIFESNEQTIIARSILKPGRQGWHGVEQHSSETRTYELELPRGHATVRCGKFFEVRFFLNVTVSLSNTKLVSVQLPIILIHINSLDVLPNSVAQVAAAIGEKRAHGQNVRLPFQNGGAHSRQRSASSPAAMVDLRRRHSYSQGRAFAAPRQQSADRQQAMRADIADLRQTLDSSPRKFEPRLHGAVIKKVGSNTSIATINAGLSQNPGYKTDSDLGYHTPPPVDQARRHIGAGNDRARDGFASRLGYMQSLDSFQRKDSKRGPKQQRKDENSKPQYQFSVVPNRIEPHILGLSATDLSRLTDPITRPSTGLSFREKMDRRRFEFKAVRSKGSGSLRERGMHWLEQVKHKDKEKEGWI